MRTKTFGSGGAKVSEIGMGTYYDPLWIATAFAGWRRGASRKVGSLNAGLEGGINLIDTAEIYGSEPLVAEAIRGRKREDLFIATKVWSNHLRRDALVASLEKSLRRLGLDYVDLYQVHRPNSRVPISETMGAMEELKEKGKVLEIGVSNFSLKQLVEASQALRKSKIASNQVSYSLANRSIESDLLPHCEREGIAVLAYYPLGHGKLAKERRRLDALCRRVGKTPSQVALRWLASKENVIPIPRASRVEHVRENLDASDWEMSESDRSELESIFPR